MKEYGVSNNSSTELLHLVACQLSNEEFGIEISKVKEIIRIPDITKIPQSQEYVEGIINLRGNVIPIINLAARFNLQHDERSDDSRIMVVELGNLIAGMIVDSVTEVLSISTEDIEPAPDFITSKLTERYIQGVGKIDKRLIILLNIENIFTDEQKLEIGQIENAGPIPA